MSEKLVIDVVVEIPKNSNIKYEFNPRTNRLHVDRILFGAGVYPQNYGFIENTLDWDGDALDVLVIANQGFQVGAVLPTRVLGAMSMVDGGETDTKLIGVIECDPRFAFCQTLKDVPAHLLAEIKDFFATYKNLQHKKVEVGEFHDVRFACAELKACRELFQQYRDLPKAEFIAQMRTKHPEKYKK